MTIEKFINALRAKYINSKGLYRCLNWDGRHLGVLSSCTGGTPGNSHCISFVLVSLDMCGVLFGLLYRLLCTGTQGHNPFRDRQMSSYFNYDNTSPACETESNNN